MWKLVVNNATQQKIQCQSKSLSILLKEYMNTLKETGGYKTGVACKNTGRNYILMEKEQEYIDIINKRLSE